MIRQVSDSSNAHVLLHANDVMRACRLCDHVDSISLLMDSCQIGTTGCYCLTPSAYFVDTPNPSIATWKIIDNCFHIKILMPEFRRVNLTFVWKTAARYVAQEYNATNKSKFPLVCNRNEPVRLNKECEGRLSLTVSSTEVTSHALEYGATFVISIMALIIYIGAIISITVYSIVTPYVRVKTI